MPCAPTRLALPAAFREHLKAVQATRSAGRATPAKADQARSLVTEPHDVASFRARATHLAERLPAEGLAAAAEGGLQDTAPRAAQTALAARADGVGPGAWEHPSLVQIWFRGADYLVPRADVGVFTRGALPRDPERRQALEHMADAVLDILDGEPKTTRQITPALPDERGDYWVRALAVTGRLHIRWDARYVHVLPAEPPAVDDEEARAELARRFLRWLGPADERQFAKWAGVSRDDAAQTWRRLGGELVPVQLGGQSRWLLAADEAALRRPEPVVGVRFLPLGDPWLYLDAGLVIPGPPADIAQRTGPGVTRRLLNSLLGRILVDGHVAASWGRVGDRLTIAPWAQPDEGVRGAMALEAETLGAAIGRPMKIRWLE